MLKNPSLATRIAVCKGIGLVVGLLGVVTRHPVLMPTTPWWVRTLIVGAWLNFVLAFLAYRDMQAVMTATVGLGGALSSPFRFVLEGGEGRASVDG